MSRLGTLKEKLSDYLLLVRNRNKPYISYYRDVMRRDTLKNPIRAVGMVADDIGERQLGRLKKHGLLPQHTLFDFGCGRLRGGVAIIRYLDASNYFGNDISPEILAYAREIIEADPALYIKNPRLYLTDDLSFKEVAGKTFDYVHAQSVLSHMPPEDISELFKNVRHILRPESKFIASYFPSKTGAIYPRNQQRDFHYPFSWFVETGKKYGLTVEPIDDLPGYKAKQPLMLVKTL
ncbi:MAG TPA: class I SAM-dependent methyltransferase [Candidatus Paceibacterota bacterium]|jgi:SAM-dependent methyltransferase|nr:class I SAM-dependent methyltransferase [Candidatus Paceibacterota bacterium]